jgi:hypothetical protein
MEEKKEERPNEETTVPTESSPATKRLRVNEQSDFVATSAGENAPSTEISEIKAESDDSVEEEICSLCMETGTEDCPLIPHQCLQCAPDSWKICQCCNEALLSRSCPVCRGDYAPIVMYPMPGFPLSSLADSSLSEEERTNLLYKFGIIRHMIGKSNSAIWSPVSNKMLFCLPQKIHSNDNNNDQSFAIVSITMNEDRVTGTGENAPFLFTNKIWDEIENEVESGEVTAGQIVEQQQAIQSVLSITKDPGHKLFTMLSPEDWHYMLDPSESNDTTEALKAIKSSIFKPILPQMNRK